MSEANNNGTSGDNSAVPPDDGLQAVKDALEQVKSALLKADESAMLAPFKKYNSLLEAYYKKSGSYENANAIVQELLKFINDNPAVSKSFENVMKDPAFINLAVDNFKRAIDSNPSDTASIGLLNEILIATKDYHTMKEVFGKLAGIFPTDSFYFFQLGYAEMQLKEYNNALLHFEKVIKLSPNDYIAFYNAGLCNEFLPDTSKAVEYYKQCLLLNNIYEPAFNSLKAIYEKQKDWQATAALCKTAIDAGITSISNYFDLAFALHKIENYPDSVRYYDMVIADKNYPNLHLAYNNKAVALEKSGNNEEAKQCYDLAIAQKPDYTQAIYNRGLLSENTNDSASMLKDMKNCLGIDPFYKNAINHIWEFLYFRQEYPELQEIIGELLQKQNPQDADCLFYKAILQTDMDKIDEAVQDYSKLILQYPDYELGYYNYAYLLLDKRRYGDAIDILNTATQKGKAEARKFYELGNAYLDSLAYYKARNAYDEALKIDPTYVYGMHNRAWIYEKLGDYQTARKQWKEILPYYAEIVKAGTDPDLASKTFYYAEILNYSLQSKKYELIEDLYQQAIKANGNFTAPYLSLIRLYQQRKMQMKDNGSDDSFHSIKNEWHIKMLDAYSTGIEILKKEIIKKPTKHNLAELGEFYLTMEMYDEAIGQYNKALEKDENYVRGYTGLGVAQAKLEQYKDGIANFKRAAMLDPDDLNLQSNLGDAYRKAGMPDMAESTFQKILKNTPFYIDAHIGLGECYKAQGDKSMEDKDSNQAEEYFSKAKDLFNKALTLSKTDDKVSKTINNAEKSGIHYSLGYTKVRLFEMAKGLNLFLLKSAQEDFMSITPEQDEYFKAQKAVKKIKERIYSSFSAAKAAPAFIFFMAVLIFLIVQYIFYFNRYQQKNEYSLNKKELSAWLATTPIDSAAGPRIKSWADNNFSTIEEFQNKLEEIIPEDYLSKAPAAIVNTRKVDVRENLSELSYGFFTFGAMVFMVVGLFLKDITRLKLGSIEMDKNAVDNLSTSTSLGVMK